MHLHQHRESHGSPFSSSPKAYPPIPHHPPGPSGSSPDLTVTNPVQNWRVTLHPLPFSTSVTSISIRARSTRSARRTLLQAGPHPGRLIRMAMVSLTRSSIRTTPTTIRIRQRARIWATAVSRLGSGTELPLTPGETLVFEVDNSYPGGEPRTPGYWKNWNACTGGGQYDNAMRNGGGAGGILDIG